MYKDGYEAFCYGVVMIGLSGGAVTPYIVCGCTQYIETEEDLDELRTTKQDDLKCASAMRSFIKRISAAESSPTSNYGEVLA